MTTGLAVGRGDYKRLHSFLDQHEFDLRAVDANGSLVIVDVPEGTTHRRVGNVIVYSTIDGAIFTVRTPPDHIDDADQPALEKFWARDGRVNILRDIE